MRKDLLWLGLCSALGAALMLAVPALAGNGEPAKQEAVMTLLEQGVRHYDKGEYAEAKKAFDEMLALRPSSQMALQMRRRAELGVFAKMAAAQDEELAATARRVLDMMNQAVRETKRDIPDVQQLLNDFQSPDLRTYLDARMQLASHGPYAVPYLLQFLQVQGHQNQTIVARTMSVLADIGRPAGPPLIEALAAEDEMVRLRVAAALGQLGEKRAVAALLAVCEDPDAAAPTVKAAEEALRAITGGTPAELGTAVEQYEALIAQYLAENRAAAGYVYGEWQEVWYWDPQGKALQDRLRYELVPTYLYYQRQAAENALKALRTDPGNANLQGFLLASLCRQLRLTRSAAELSQDEAMQRDAAARAAQLEVRVPVVGHLCDAAVVGRALRYALSLGDGATSLYLVKLLGTKAGRETGEAADALLAAVEFPDKDVRARASLEIVKASPTGAIGNPLQVMQALSVALHHAAKRTALLISNDLETLNKLAVLVENEGWQALKSNAHAAAIEQALDLWPSVDAVFLSADLDEALFDSAFGKLKSDVRTRSVALYVIAGGRQDGPDLSGYEGITSLLGRDDVRSARIAPLLEQVAEQGAVPTEAERAETVLLAALALAAVDPATTRYPLQTVEPALIAALRGYGEAVSLAAADCLARFGSANALGALGSAVSDPDSSPELRASACRAIAAVAARAGEPLSQPVLDALMGAFASDIQFVREAAAEALSVSGIGSERLTELINAEVAAP